MGKIKENNWATPTLKEEPFWREGMTPEEFEVERNYYLKNWDRWNHIEYVPLWKQNNN